MPHPHFTLLLARSLPTLRAGMRATLCSGAALWSMACTSAPDVAPEPLTQEARSVSFALSQNLDVATIQPAIDFDYDSGNIGVSALIPAIVPVLAQTVSPSLGDAPLVLRVTTLVTNAWFDAIAPYHPTATGIYSELERRPPSESTTNRHKNIAMAYATYRVLLSVMPQGQSAWRQLMSDLGLDPDAETLAPDSPIGIGNLAGQAIVAARIHDGMNQLGDEGGRRYNLRPYEDYTGYKPVNTPQTIVDPSRWQPDTTTTGTGLFASQSFVTPQLRFTEPYAYADVSRLHVRPPVASQPRGRRGRARYKAQADEVLRISAELTDYQKSAAELFDNKIRSLGFSVVAYSQVHGLSLDEFVQLDFLTNAAAFDGAIATWQEKYRYDAVRPFTAIKWLYGERPVTAWGGPGQGTVDDMPASQWRSYLNTANHPEYPSASACFCAAHAQAVRRFAASDAFGWAVDVPQGSSQVEPGITPATDLVLGPYETWTDFEKECGISRVWGGTHFMAAVKTSRAFCPRFGDLAYEFVAAHIRGETP